MRAQCTCIDDGAGLVGMAAHGNDHVYVGTDVGDGFAVQASVAMCKADKVFKVAGCIVPAGRLPAL